MNFYDFKQRVHLRRDPSQFGLIGCGGYGDTYDLETRTQLVFWEHEGADVVTSESVDDLMSEEEYTSTQTMERLYDAVQASLDEREEQG
jgi:hypothetical protein